MPQATIHQPRDHPHIIALLHSLSRKSEDSK